MSLAFTYWGAPWSAHFLWSHPYYHSMRMEVVMGKKDIWSVQRRGAALSMRGKEKPAGVGQKAQESNCKPSRKKKWWAQAAAPEEGRPPAVNHPGS